MALSFIVDANAYTSNRVSHNASHPLTAMEEVKCDYIRPLQDDPPMSNEVDISDVVTTRQIGVHRQQVKVFHSHRHMARLLVSGVVGTANAMPLLSIACFPRLRPPR